ncbi:MAG: hypothetical protein ACI9MC_001600 [Kiritimatiellia bacterium]|jgi:hypothetical protein
MAKRSWFRWWMIPASPLALGLVCSGVVGYAVAPCFSLWWQYGVVSDRCNVGDVRVGGDVTAHHWLRGEESEVRVIPNIRHMAKGLNYVVSERITAGYTVELQLLDLEEQPVQGVSFGKGFVRGDEWRSKVTLPDLPDGDYTLRATMRIAGDEAIVDVPVALYAPALAHVASDRPLYKPGQEVQLRSVLLRRTDQAPLDGRPGVWTIYDPTGQKMLQQKERAGAWGIADTSFLLDASAQQGTWRAQWTSAGATDSVSFDVRPFQLPRFTVEAAPISRWYHVGDDIIVEGTARYTSGAPVADSPVTLQVASSDAWPIPVPWEELFDATTDAQGRFRIQIGSVPAEPYLVRNRVELSVTARVTDTTGEAAAGGSRVILSHDDVRAEVITEMPGDALAGGFNNRVYIRALTPDGRALRGAVLSVRPAMDLDAKGWTATTDWDGVAALQVDPGEPVSVPQPAVPVRFRPRVQQPVGLRDLRRLDGAQVSLPARRAFDRLNVGLLKCSDITLSQEQVRVGLRVGASGIVQTVQASTGLLDRCVAGVVRTVRLPAGPVRTYSIEWSIPDSLAPGLELTVERAFGGTDEGLGLALVAAQRVGRRCLSAGHGVSGAVAARVHWSVDARSKRPTFEVQTPSGSGLSTVEQRCLSAAVRGVALTEEAELGAMGVATLRLKVAHAPGPQVAQSTFTTGYSLAVAARTDGAELGSTTVLLSAAQIPNLRIRATPSLAKTGDKVQFTLLRGPGFRGSLPKEVRLMKGSVRIAKVALDPDAPVLEYTIPDDVRGFLHVEVLGQRGVVFVERADRLSVVLSTDSESYAPGETAKLTVRTEAGGKPVSAAVGLMGVDQTLSQLAPLLDPDDMGRVTVRVESEEAAFGSFDPRALMLGRVKGLNAARAAVLRVTKLPDDPAGDQAVYASGSVAPDDMEILTRQFWRGREALVQRVRLWENSAPKGEMMSNAKMAELWGASIVALANADEPVADAFGRQLELNMLPDELIARLNPREIVADGTRLPEDVRPWEVYVQTEVR